MRNYSTVVAIFGLIVINVSLAPIYALNGNGPESPITEFWLQYSSIVLSTLSVFAIAFTLWLQIRSNKIQESEIEQNKLFAVQNYDSQLLVLIKQLMEERLEQPRYRCWELMADLQAEQSARAEMKQVFEYTMRDQWIDRKTALTNTNSERHKDFASFIKLVRHFDIMSRYRFSEVTASALNFYYIYYRRFFIDMAEMYRDVEETMNADEKMHYVSPAWLGVVERLDNVMRDFDLPLR